MPAEGSPLIIVPSGIFKNAPNPNAARLFQSFFFSAETQQMLVDTFAHRSFHAQVKEKGAHIPLAESQAAEIRSGRRCWRRARRSRRATPSCSGCERDADSLPRKTKGAPWGAFRFLQRLRGQAPARDHSE